MLVQRSIAAGTKVKMATPATVPVWSTWDDDGHRTSNSVKKRLQQMFFKGDRRIAAEVIYISSESEREKLRNLSRCKLQIRDAAGSVIVITADSTQLKAI
jgi:hypothetical protein